MQKTIYILTLLICVLLASCEKQAFSFPDYEDAEKMLMEKPDSLAALLENRIDPALLSDSLKAEYGWWLTRVHRHLNRSLMNDTIIHFTLRYYEKHGSPRLPFTYLMAGEQVNWSGNKHEEQAEFLKKGFDIAVNQSDTALWMKIASDLSQLYFMLGDIRSSIEAGNPVLHVTDGYLYERMLQFYETGCGYGKLRLVDSMRICLKEAIRIAHDLKEDEERDITRNYIECLIDLGQNEEALPLLHDFYERYPLRNTNDSLVYNFSYACLWLNMGKMDSMRVCLDRLERICEVSIWEEYKSPYQIAMVYVTKMLEAAYDAKTGHPVKLIGAYQFSEMVAQKERIRGSIEKEQIYVQNKLEEKNLLLKIKEERGRQLILFVLLITGMMIAFLVWRYQRKLLRKERHLQQVKEQIHLHQIALRENEQLIRQNEETINQLSSQLDEHSGLSHQLNDRQAEITYIREENNILLQEKQKLEQEISRFMQAVPGRSTEMDAYERIAEQNMVFITYAKQVSSVLINQHEELKRLRYGEIRHLSDIEWPAVYLTIDRIFNKYTQRLRQDYPLLTEEDIQCCCLIKLQLSTSAIAALYCIAPSSVTKRKQRIKERINQMRGGLIGKEQPVDVYLWGY